MNYCRLTLWCGKMNLIVDFSGWFTGWKEKIGGRARIGPRWNRVNKLRMLTDETRYCSKSFSHRRLSAVDEIL